MLDSMYKPKPIVILDYLKDSVYIEQIISNKITVSKEKTVPSYKVIKKLTL